MDSLLQDIRYALRVLRNSPGFTVVSVLTLALGIVGTTLVFNAYNATMWQPLPVQAPERLGVLQRHFRKGGENRDFSLDDYRRIRESSRVFSGVVAEGEYETVLAQLPELRSGKLEEPRQILVKLVSDNYFDVLGIRAGAGRVFRSGESASETPVAVLSYTSWHRRFREDPAIVGKTILIYGAAATIVGIAPRDFVGTGDPPIPADVWVPLSAQAAIEPQRAAHGEGEQWLRIVGRLRPGATAAQAERELTALEQQDEKDRGAEPVTAAMVAGPAFYFVEPGNPQFRAMAALLLASFSMVLLVACANMANFFMARAARRRREMAVRSALGASRGRLVRQLMTEGVLLGLAGGAVAAVAATWICSLVWLEVEQRIIARFTDLYFLTFSFAPNARVLAATCGVSVLAGALFSSVGALQSSRVDVNEIMKGSEVRLSSGRRFRLSLRDLLIAVQVTLSVVLLVSAALLARGMVRGQYADPGFNTHNVLNIEFAGLESAGFNDARAASLRDQLRNAMTRMPGVTSVAFSRQVPLLGVGKEEIARPGSAPNQALDNEVSPGFFATLGIPLVRGRDFTEEEIAHRADVVIVSQTTAHNLWPGDDPVGKVILIGSQHRPVQVIGLAQDVRSVNIGKIEPYFLYLPLVPDAPLHEVFLHTASDASREISQALKTASLVDTRLGSLALARSLDDALWAQHLPSTIATICAMVVGSLALFLASVGIYGTMSYAVAQRTREIGIRIALGAQKASILFLVLSRAMALAGAGTCIGLVAAIGAWQAFGAIPFGLQSLLLFSVSPTDPYAFCGVASFLALVALAAAYGPAYRATSVDPVVALRYE